MLTCRLRGETDHCCHVPLIMDVCKCIALNCTWYNGIENALYNCTPSHPRSLAMFASKTGYLCLSNEPPLYLSHLARFLHALYTYTLKSPSIANS
jgi:hypothetical protein